MHGQNRNRPSDRVGATRHRPLRFEPLEGRRLLAAFDVLVFSETTGFRHGSIDEGIAAVEALGAANDFSVNATEDSSVFTDPGLAEYEAVVFLNTTGQPLNAAEQAGFQAYIQQGGGYVGVHAAADTHAEWAWYVDLLGASFDSHPAVQQATVVVADRVDGSTSHLPERWDVTEEWYNFTANPRGDVHVLATLDESTYSGGTMGFDHPLAWRQYFDGGRSWYTGLGHREATFADPLFREHLLGGIRFAAGQAPADRGATVDANWEKVVLDANVSDPMSLEVAPDGTVYFVELDGAVKAIDPTNGSVSTIGSFDVRTGNEDGLLGIALDPGFATNGWVYFFYTPNQPQVVQRISRITLTGGALDMGTEQVLLEVPSDGTCCHTAGSLAFGPDGLLYISLGDDTNPFQSDGFGPIDERPGREDFDAQRTSGNADDLRGAILRIRPEADGTYSIPAGNLFPADGSAGRPEIYVMGVRNPFRISVDQQSGALYWGDVGPDANFDTSSRGPRGYDELNRAEAAGNYGWPYIIADNQAYRDFNFATNGLGPLFDPTAMVNDSPNNTGPTNLPDAEPALLWYPYAPSDEFPEFGAGGRTIMAGPVYHYDAALDSDRKLPEYFNESLFVYDWSRRAFWEVKFDASGAILKINEVFDGLTFTRPVEAELGPDGALYVIEWGSTFGGNNGDAQVVRVDFTGALPSLPGDYNGDGLVNAADFTVWREADAGVPGSGPADGDGDGVTNTGDELVWRSNYGATAPAPAALVEEVVEPAASFSFASTETIDASPSPPPVIEAATGAADGDFVRRRMLLIRSGSLAAHGDDAGVIDEGFAAVEAETSRSPEAAFEGLGRGVAADRLS